MFLRLKEDGQQDIDTYIGNNTHIYLICKVSGEMIDRKVISNSCTLYHYFGKNMNWFTFLNCEDRL